MIIAILAVPLAVLMLNLIFPFGIVFSCHGGFRWSGTYIFEEFIKDSQSTTVVLGDEHPGDPIIYIPLVLCVYGVESPPYTINLKISDETESFEKIFIELVSIEYIDGQKVSHNIDWERTLEDSSVHRYVNDANLNEYKLIVFPAKRLHDKLPVTVDRRQSCNIRFVGYFVNKEGVKISFDTTKHFEYAAYEWKMY